MQPPPTTATPPIGVRGAGTHSSRVQKRKRNAALCTPCARTARRRVERLPRKAHTREAPLPVGQHAHTARPDAAMDHVGVAVQELQRIGHAQEPDVDLHGAARQSGPPFMVCDPHMQACGDQERYVDVLGSRAR